MESDVTADNLSQSQQLLYRPFVYKPSPGDSLDPAYSLPITSPPFSLSPRPVPLKPSPPPTSRPTSVTFPLSNSPVAPIQQSSIYKPLVPEQIRVLKVLHGPRAGLVECYLLRATVIIIDGVRLDEEWHERNVVQYTALSYSWGWPQATAHVMCNGEKFPVTPHLESALRYFRSENEDRYLWTDAFCINQQDLHEKGSQVERMFQIYQRATTVFCWLGKSDMKHHSVLKMLATFNKQRLQGYMDDICYVDILQYHAWLPEVPRNFWGKMAWPPSKEIVDEWCETVFHTKSFASEFEELVDTVVDFVANCTWFRRTWVRQEMFAAKNIEVVCEPFEFDLRHLNHILQYKNDSPLALLPYETMMKPWLRKIFHETSHLPQMAPVSPPSKYTLKEDFSSETTTFLELVLDNAAGFEVSNDLDRIYALQGMAESELAKKLRILPTTNYNKNFRDLAAEFTKYMIYYNGVRQALLILERREATNVDGWPSWLTDFTLIKPRVCLSPYPSTPSSIYSRSWLKSSLRPEYLLSLDIQGVWIGWVGEPVSATDSQFIHWDDSLDRNDRSKMTDAFPTRVYGSRSAYSQHMLTDTMKYKYSYFKRGENLESIRMVLKRCLEDDISGPHFASNPYATTSSDDPDDVATEIIMTSEDIREDDLVVMSDQYVQSYSIAHSDVITNIPSYHFYETFGDVVFILRRVSHRREQKTRYKFLGPAFILSRSRESGAGRGDGSLFERTVFLPRGHATSRSSTPSVTFTLV